MNNRRLCLDYYAPGFWDLCAPPLIGLAELELRDHTMGKILLSEVSHGL
ncbi:MAG: hypothetical protein LBG07_06165 [Treponema sp.]|nr:hypothetical protein [Treponema sp.]